MFLFDRLSHPITCLTLLPLLSSCSPIQFNPRLPQSTWDNPPLQVDPGNNETPQNAQHGTPPVPTPAETINWKPIIEQTYLKQWRIFQTFQEVSQKNETTISFKVFDEQHRPVHQLKAEDFLVTESDIPVSQIKHYEFSDFISRKNSLDTVTSEIIMDATTAYQIIFDADEMRFANLPIQQRQIKVELHPKHPHLKVVLQSISSNLPLGRPELKKSWKISDHDVLPSSLKVEVNGVNQTDQIRFYQNHIYFLSQPAPGSQIKVFYHHKNSRINYNLFPIEIPQRCVAEDFSIFINGQPLSHSLYPVTQHDSTKCLITFLDQLFEDETHLINRTEKIDLKIFIKD